jgi:hypothetical protein
MVEIQIQKQFRLSPVILIYWSTAMRQPLTAGLAAPPPKPKLTMRYPSTSARQATANANAVISDVLAASVPPPLRAPPHKVQNPDPGPLQQNKGAIPTVAAGALQRPPACHTNLAGELRRIYLGLRACRDVPYIHLQSDSEYALMQINRFWREGCQNCLQTTAHRDLICSTVKELQLRGRRHGKGHLWLEKVTFHDDELTHDEPTTSP